MQGVGQYSLPRHVGHTFEPLPSQSGQSSWMRPDPLHTGQATVRASSQAQSDAFSPSHAFATASANGTPKAASIALSGAPPAATSASRRLGTSLLPATRTPTRRPRNLVADGARGAPSA